MLPGHGFSNWIPHLHSSLLFCFELVKRRPAQCFFNLIFTWQIFLSLHLSKFTDMTWKETRTSSNPPTAMLRACPPSALNADRFQRVWQPLLAILGSLEELPYVIHLGTRAKLTRMCAPPFHPPHSSPLPLAFFFSLWYSRLLWKLPFRWSYDDSFLPHKFPSLTSCVFFVLDTSSPLYEALLFLAILELIAGPRSNVTLEPA